jgi:carboxypeptidase C (cathepsin A)
LDISVIQNKKSIHYVFFESQSDITKDPLILWLSGGPACSSLLGAFHENGPFVFRPEQSKFELNKHAWNKNANMLYLELPAGVGFSQA